MRQERDSPIWEIQVLREAPEDVHGGLQVVEPHSYNVCDLGNDHRACMALIRRRRDVVEERHDLVMQPNHVRSVSPSLPTLQAGNAPLLFTFIARRAHAFHPWCAPDLCLHDDRLGLSIRGGLCMLSIYTCASFAGEAFSFRPLLLVGFRVSLSKMRRDDGWRYVAWAGRNDRAWIPAHILHQHTIRVSQLCNSHYSTG